MRIIDSKTRTVFNTGLYFCFDVVKRVNLRPDLFSLLENHCGVLVSYNCGNILRLKIMFISQIIFSTRAFMRNLLQQPLDFHCWTKPPP